MAHLLDTSVTVTTTVAGVDSLPLGGGLPAKPGKKATPKPKAAFELVLEDTTMPGQALDVPVRFASTYATGGARPTGHCNEEGLLSASVALTALTPGRSYLTWFRPAAGAETVRGGRLEPSAKATFALPEVAPSAAAMSGSSEERVP